MKRKLIFGVIILFSLMLIFGCKGNQSLSSDYPKTIEELKEKKATNPSEYDKCLQEIEENQNKEELCVRNKLKEKGYEDNVECIKNFNDPTCNLDIDSCTSEKVKTLGYDDNIDCDWEWDNPACTSKRIKDYSNAKEECYKISEEKTARYNAEVDATNKCREQFKGGLTLLDCMELIGK